MKKISGKRMMSAALACIMFASSMLTLASCGKKEPVKEKRTNVYSGEEILMPEGVEYVQNLFSGDENTVYLYYNKTYTITYNDLGEEVERVSGYDWNDEALADGWYQDYESMTYIATVDLTSGSLNEQPVDMEQDTSGMSNTYISSMAADSSGTVWALINRWEYSEDYSSSTNTYMLRSIDPASGTRETEIILNDALKNAGVDESNMYVSGFALSGDGTIYVKVDTSVVGMDANGTFRQKYELDAGGWINQIFTFGNKLYILYYPENGSQQIKVVENGQMTDLKSDNLTQVLSNYYSIYGFSDTKMYYGTSYGVNVYDMTTDTTAELLNYINSDIDSSGSNNFLILPDERIVEVQTDWSNGNSRTTMSILTRVPDEQLQEEIILKLGCVYSDYYLTKAIIRFNKQNTGVRISVKQYSEYNNEENEWKGAGIQFNNDIVTGNVPDLVLLSTELPVESYFQKGIFTDLYKFIDDPDLGINRTDYLENVFQACEVDGKLNSMILSFTLNTLAAKSQYVGTESGWTLAEMMNVIQNMPEGMSAFMEYSRQNILENFFIYSMDSFVNWDTGETYFNDEGFIKFIEFLATCPEKGFWQSLYPDDGEYVYDEELEKEYSQKYDLRFYKDYSLFYMAYLSSFSGIMNIRGQFANADITFVGYPTNDETSNGAVIIPEVELAISATSLAQEEAWSFIKFVLNDEEYNNNTWAFSTNILQLEKNKETAKENYYYYEPSDEDLAWYKEYYSEEYYEYMKSRNMAFDEASLDQTMDLIKSASNVQRNDSSLLEIINEELSAFFAGTRSAEETAKIIDSRARIYVSENS